MGVKGMIGINGYQNMETGLETAYKLIQRISYDKNVTTRKYENSFSFFTTLTILLYTLLQVFLQFFQPFKKYDFESSSK